MLFSHLNDHYQAQSFTNRELERMAEIISPYSEEPKIAELSDFPNKYFALAQTWIDGMRNSSELREQIYTGMGEMYINRHLVALKEIVDAEIKLYALSMATQEYYRASNMEIPEQLRKDNQQDVRQCQQRLSWLTSVIDDTLEEAVDEENLYSVTRRIEEKLGPTSDEYLAELRRGRDYSTARAYELDALAHKYLLAAAAYTDTGGLHVAIQMLRLEDEPKNFGNEEHVEAHRALQFDIAQAKRLTDQAYAMFPQLQPAPRNSTGGNSPAVRKN